MRREIERLANEPFDVLVVGGGVLGACVARDAAMRGLRTALVESEDFGAGASWNCLKILHGGLRYLQHLDLSRARRSIRERSFWLRAAPHLAEPLPVVVPSSGDGLTSRTSVLFGALLVNDLVSMDRNRGLSPGRRIPGARIRSRREVLRQLPELADSGVRGGVEFHDALMYSAERLVLSVVKSAVRHGAVAVNHASFERGVVADGRVTGARVRDRVGGSTFTVRAGAVVNAAGAAAGACAARLGPGTSAPDVGMSVAVNVGIPRLPHDRALAVEGRTGGSGTLRPGRRRLLLVPWRDLTLVGTGHFPFDGPADAFDEPGPYVDRFVDEVRATVPGLSGRLEDLRLVHSGLLPARSLSDGGVDLVKHPVVVDHAEEGAAGAVTALSVKFTTARAVAEELIDRVSARLDAAVGPCRTASDPLEDAPSGSVDELQEGVRRRYGDRIEPAVLDHLVRLYGEDAAEMLESCEGTPGGLERPDPSLPVLRGQLRYGVTEEMAVSVDDLLRRRVDVGARGRVSPELRGEAERALADTPANAEDVGRQRRDATTSGRSAAP